MKLFLDIMEIENVIKQNFFILFIISLPVIDLLFHLNHCVGRQYLKKEKEKIENIHD